MDEVRNDPAALAGFMINANQIAKATFVAGTVGKEPVEDLQGAVAGPPAQWNPM